MLPGPNLILECPDCGRLARVATVASGNTFGAHLYSDGRMVAPMMPDVPEVGHCAGCGAYWWIDEDAAIGEFMTGAEESAHPEWVEADAIEPLSEADYLEAIGAGLGDSPEREERLRILAWWAGNDAVRDRAPEIPAPSRFAGEDSSAARNLRRLAQLLGSKRDLESRLMRGEAFRQLGEFRVAMLLLRDAWPDELEVAAEVVRELARSEDAWVRLVDDGS